jgi:hypothetical protein
MPYATVKADILAKLPLDKQVTAESSSSPNGITWTELTIAEEGHEDMPFMRRYFTEHEGTTYEVSTKDFLATFAFTN